MCKQPATDLRETCGNVPIDPRKTREKIAVDRRPIEGENDWYIGTDVAQKERLILVVHRGACGAYFGDIARNFQVLGVVLVGVHILPCAELAD